MIDGMSGEKLKADKIQEMVPVPDVQTILDTIDLSSLENFNSSDFQLPEFDFNLNVTAEIETVRDAINGFTAASLDADYGNRTRVDQFIIDFNVVLNQINPSFADFTFQYIVQTYVLTNTAFKV